MSTAVRSLALLALAALLGGCPTREFYLQDSQVPWERSGIRQVVLPPFEAQPDAWVVADAAHQAIKQALARGTVELVDQGGQATLKGAVSTYRQSSLPGSPRRVAHTENSGGLQLESYTWEMEVTHSVQVGLVLRLLDSKGAVIWTRDAYGDASESENVTMNWPGSDPVPPPAILPYPPSQSTYARLRDRALDQALSPLIDALTVHYGYKNL